MCFLHGQGQKSEQKPTTKNFDGFRNHSPLLTMYFGTSERIEFEAVTEKIICKIPVSFRNRLSVKYIVTFIRD